MIDRYATFSFELDKKAITHIKDLSSYNHNYYQLDLSVYGDYITPATCNILYEEFEEFSETYTYTLGYFEPVDTGVNFIKCFTWIETQPKFLTTIIEGN